MKKITLLVFFLSTLARFNAQNQSYTICQGSAITLTAGTYPGITGVTFSINPGGTTSSSPYFNVSPSVTTTYTLYTSGNNGMGNVTYSNQATVNIMSNATYSLSSNLNFVLGCNSLSATVVKIFSVTTNPPGMNVTFSLMTPGSGPVSPGGPLLQVTDFTITAPGIYSVVIRSANSCDTYAPFTILQNTLAPVPDSIKGSHLLTCFNPSTTLVPVISGSNIGYVWSWGNFSTAGPITVLATTVAPTQTLVGNFTLTLTDQTSQCTSKHLFQVKQNIYKPIAKISGPSGVLTCLQPSVVLSNQSSTGIPPISGYPTNSLVIGYLWEGPSIGPPQGPGSTYTATVAGVYTLTVMDLNNGCTSKTTAVVAENRLVPLVNAPVSPANICGNITTVTLVPSISSNITNLSFTWTASGNATMTGINSPVLVTNSPGDYLFTAQDKLSGCMSTVTLQVVYCVGVSDHDNAGIRLFPNPADDILYVTSPGSEEFELVARDIHGKIVMKSIVYPNAPIAIEHLENGVYFVELLHQGNIKGRMRVIKM